MILDARECLIVERVMSIGSTTWWCGLVKGKGLCKPHRHG